MKIIDNRYKINKNIYNDLFIDAYKVEDLWKNNNVKLMKLYHYNLQQELIDYFIINQIKISSVKHKNILQSEEFNIISTIDTKNTNIVMYYSISEYIEYMSLEDKNAILNFEEKLKILLDIILTLDFLHYRGYTYKFLNPTQIILIDNNSIKLQNLASIIEKTFYDEYSEFERKFLSPDFIANKKNEDKTIDYYSLAQLMKYMFIEDRNMSNYFNDSHDKDSTLDFLNCIILDLEKQSFQLKKINLVELADKIINFFQIGYKYDLIKERDILFLNNQIVGRDKEILKLQTLDNSLSKGLNLSNLVMINGEYGIGKTRFLQEISHRLKLSNKSVYSIKIKEKSDDDIINIRSILRQSMQDTPNDLKEKYRKEFSSILPELKISQDKEKSLDVNNRAQKYRIYNRITHYLKDLSSSRTIYLLLDDIHNSSDNFLNLIDYLINNLKDDNIVFVFSYDGYELETKKDINIIIKTWIKDLNALEIKLHKLDLEEIGEIIKNIIGISYVPLKLSSALFKESQGSPKKIEEFIYYLYNIGQLYMASNGRWKLKIDDYSDIYIPSNINDTILQQLNIIQENYYEIIKIMSIFEDLLPKGILIRMLNIKGEKLESLLEELSRMKLIEEKLVDWGYSYSINNLEVKRLIYFEISQTEKIKLHAKASKAIENLGGDLYDSLFEELIYQLIKSMQKEKALEIILNKVKMLENRFGSQAKYLLDKAYNIVNKDADNLIKLEILEMLININMIKGEINEESTYLKDYIHSAQSLDSKFHILNYRRIVAEIYFQRGKIDLCKEQINKINEINKYENIPKFEIYSLITTELINIQEDNLEKAKNQLQKAKGIAEEFSMYSYLGNIYNRLGILENLSGNQNIAIDYYKKSYEFFIKDKNIVESVKPINNLGNIYIDYLNDSKKGIEYYQKGSEISAKYGIKKTQLIFLINISEVNFKNYKYDKALENILEANKMAIELQDINSIIACQGILGKLYLQINEYKKAYQCYNQIKTLFKDGKITDMEISLYYYEFLGSFYLYIGNWDKALEHEEIAKKLSFKSNKRKYYKSTFNIILINLLKDEKFNEDILNGFINEYKSTKYVEDFRECILILTILNVFKGNDLYAIKLLEYDKEIRDKAKIEFLDKMRSIALILLTPNKYNTDKLINIEKMIRNDQFVFKTMLITEIGSRLSKQNKHKEAVKFYIEALNTIYRSIRKIPKWDFKISFIKSRNTDSIKRNLAIIFKEVYGKDIDLLEIDDISEKEDFEMLKTYFKSKGVIDIIGKEEFSKINQMHYSREALDIKDTNSLLIMLTDDYNYNLDLILNYLSKETFATRAFILESSKKDGDYNDYNIVSSLNADGYKNINENILNISNRTERGLLVTNDSDSFSRKIYRNCLEEDITAMICVPIYTNNGLSKIKKESRKHINNKKDIVGYIYLETDRAFNNFNMDTLYIIESILYLIYINLENNRLKLIATTDKLTGTFTRKYYEQIFKEYIDSRKSIDYGFALLMIDIDDFKVINDTYGHRKGDEVLSKLGRAIKNSVRSTDIVARYGGEEFIVILKDSGEDEAFMIGDKIRKSVEDLDIKSIEKKVKLSMGISIYPNHSKFKEDLVEKADQALYHAKQTGKNKVCVWNHKMGSSFEKIDKLAGILTGTSEIDNKNVLGLINIIQLIEEENNLEEKIYKFLNKLLNVIDAETATIIILDKIQEKYYTRIKSNESFVDDFSMLNRKIIDRVIANKKGEFLIDWDNLEDIDFISGIPNWKSIIVVPMIRNGKIKGITYVSTPLKKKEFDFNCFNLIKSYTGIFTSLV